MTASIPGIEASRRQASRPAGSRHRGQQASKHRGQQAAGIKAHLTKKENNKKLKKLDLDPTPPAQQSWRNLPPVPGDTNRKKARGKPSRPDGGRSNQRARAHARTRREKTIKHQAFYKGFPLVRSNPGSQQQSRWLRPVTE